MEKLWFEVDQRLPHGRPLEKIVALLKCYFEDLDEAKFVAKLQDKTLLLIIRAMVGERLVGVKIGFEEEPGVIYSWLGGVHPKNVGQGIGKHLMEKQIDWCRENNFHKIRTKTTNQWQTMLIMNIKTGYKIVGLEPWKKGDSKIVMELQL